MTYVALGVKVWDENLDIFPQNMLWHLMRICLLESVLTLLHSERPKLYAILAFPSAIGLMRSKYKFPYLNLPRLIMSLFGATVIICCPWVVMSNFQLRIQ